MMKCCWNARAICVSILTLLEGRTSSATVFLMHRTWLMMATAIVEVGTGLALLLDPSLPVELLLGIYTSAPVTLVIGRVAGAALLSLGVMCWVSRRGESPKADRGVLIGMLLYNILVAGVLAYSGSLGLAGLLLWPAVGLHVVLAVWCVRCLWAK
jgi:hypothetical protein